MTSVVNHSIAATTGLLDANYAQCASSECLLYGWNRKVVVRVNPPEISLLKFPCPNSLGSLLIAIGVDRSSRRPAFLYCFRVFPSFPWFYQRFRRLRIKLMTTPTSSLQRVVAAEFIGTFLLIFFGCGAVHAAVLTGAQSGLWQVAVVWGVAIMLASYTIGSISGAHINPAMTIAMHLWRGFPAARILPYIGAQVAGAMLAAAALFILFEPFIISKEQTKKVTRGEPGVVHCSIISPESSEKRMAIPSATGSGL